MSILDRGEKVLTRYGNYRHCHNPAKFVKQQCDICKFYNGCEFSRKLIGYKGGKPILYGDLSEEEKDQDRNKNQP